MKRRALVACLAFAFAGAAAAADMKFQSPTGNIQCLLSTLNGGYACLSTHRPIPTDRSPATAIGEPSSPYRGPVRGGSPA